MYLVYHLQVNSTFVSKLWFRYFVYCNLLMHGISRVKHSLQWWGERGWAMLSNMEVKYLDSDITLHLITGW